MKIVRYCLFIKKIISKHIIESILFIFYIICKCLNNMFYSSMFYTYTYTYTQITDLLPLLIFTIITVRYIMNIFHDEYDKIHFTQNSIRIKIIDPFTNVKRYIILNSCMLEGYYILTRRISIDGENFSPAENINSFYNCKEDTTYFCNIYPLTEYKKINFILFHPFQHKSYNMTINIGENFNINNFFPKDEPQNFFD